MKVILGLLFVLGTASLAQARLGETPDQVEARFGTGQSMAPPLQGPWAGLKIEQFKKQGFTIEVLLTDVSIGETYRADSQLTESQVQALLTANSEGHKWKEHASGGAARMWDRDDGAIAQLLMNQFEFKSKFFVDKEKAWTKAQLPSTDGF